MFNLYFFSVLFNFFLERARFRYSIKISNSYPIPFASSRYLRFFDERYIATSFGVQPDFSLIAKACACYGEKVEEPDQIKEAFQRAMEKNREGVPAVLDFIVGWQEMDSFAEFFGWE